MATESITLKLVIDNSTNQIVSIESGKEFVDVLLSFLTFPIATILRLSEHQSSLVSLQNLYKSVDSLGTQGLLTPASKAMLLSPRNVAAEICECLAINIDDSQSQRFYVCSSHCDYELLSFIPSTRCSCGKIMSREVFLKESSSTLRNETEDVFVKRMSRFLIRDDGIIEPASTQSIISLLEKLEIKDKSRLKERVVNVNHSSIQHLLKSFFSSQTPFADVFLGSQNPRQPEHITSSTTQLRGATEASACKSTTSISIKLLVDKQENKVLYAEANRCFVDLLFSFLTFPAGAALKLLCGSTSIKCIDNLYKSAECLSSLEYLKDHETAETLLNPKLPPYYCLLKNPIKVEEEESSAYSFYMCRARRCDVLEVSISPNVRCQCNAKIKKILSLTTPLWETDEGFVKEATYLVTDDLVVTQLLSLSFIFDHMYGCEKKSVKVVAVEVGEMEALALLRASLTSSGVLTQAFASWLQGENRSFGAADIKIES